MGKQLAVYLSIGYRWALMFVSIGIFTLFLKNGFSWWKVAAATGISLTLCLLVAIPVEIYIWRKFHILDFMDGRVKALKQQWQATKQAWRDRRRENERM